MKQFKDYCDQFCHPQPTDVSQLITLNREYLETLPFQVKYLYIKPNSDQIPQSLKFFLHALLYNLGKSSS